MGAVCPCPAVCLPKGFSGVILATCDFCLVGWHCSRTPDKGLPLLGKAFPVSQNVKTEHTKGMKMFRIIDLKREFDEIQGKLREQLYNEPLLVSTVTVSGWATDSKSRTWMVDWCVFLTCEMEVKITSSTYFSNFYEDQIKQLRQERSALH